ncbi:MAG: cytochrome-c oxidase, cbb3-type subunit III [Gammaproteobacteria bacterium]|nr:cytochrome-c oxidase, cbb3-type subunit III [Gammaproteobacteria bacterium]MCW8911024.1 cytochrome-c oxidase, cbb3-type subunit III [Gammaproteobacteria bacterium]MCW9005126.1 cytochrome-c oxidase, cbb3-type subunit III [Gammaproteobacteria bacterium]MCW9056640.1 cytochrome-c oxidase, cbb3-type subunit III [Gammaproteobacteria bacterium]
MSDDNNPFPGENNTGHVWDDSLRELLNDPPTWWRIGFHASWIFVIVYCILYPAWPLLTTSTKGVLGWTSLGEYREDLKAIEEVRGPYEKKLKGMSAAAILADDELSNYVVRSAKVLFGDNCSACHGSGGQGIVGFPVLADDDWLYGGTVTDIEATITMGRKGMMPAQAALVNDAEADKLASAILAGNVASEPLFMEKGCVGCHGVDGKGMAPLGSANLTDSVWRFVAEDQAYSIKHTIMHGVNDPSDPKTRNAEMPTFGGTKLSETDIKKLAVYVHKLGGGQ